MDWRCASEGSSFCVETWSTSSLPSRTLRLAAACRFSSGSGFDVRISPGTEQTLGDVAEGDLDPKDDHFCARVCGNHTREISRRGRVSPGHQPYPAIRRAIRVYVAIGGVGIEVESAKQKQRSSNSRPDDREQSQLYKVPWHVAVVKRTPVHLVVNQLRTHTLDAIREPVGEVDLSCLWVRSCC